MLHDRLIDGDNRRIRQKMDRHLLPQLVWCPFLREQAKRLRKPFNSFCVSRISPLMVKNCDFHDQRVMSS
jgi:hypothetical protein